MDKMNPEHHGAGPGASRGRRAEAPQEIPASGWKDVLLRTWKEINDDRVLLIAAGATYYLLLSLFPSLAAFVSLYGLFTDPTTVTEHLSLLSTVVPPSGMDLLREQLTTLTEQQPATLGWGLVISLGLALWSASAGIKTMFEAMNIAYDERESRNFIKLTALALGFTLAGLIGGIVLIGVVVIMPGVLGFLGLAAELEWAAQGIGYLLVALVLFAGIAALYRFGPSRQQAKWRWLTPGAVFAVLAILVASVLFSWYTANFANYEKTYGSLGGLIGFLTWVWLSVTVVIIGGEINAEAEHQTARDSTIGADEPMGQRNAKMADTLGKSAEETAADGNDRRPGIGRSGKADRNADRTEEWHAGYRAALEELRAGRRTPSVGQLAFTVPAALTLAYLNRKRGAGTRETPRRG